jgi:putative inorganic carbon (HCO3(-)) transporter
MAYWQREPTAGHFRVTHTDIQASETESACLGPFWRLEGLGLALVGFLSFFPPLFHLNEYMFFGLLVLAMGAKWLRGESVWVRTPIDVPILLLLGWILLTLPFSIDPSYSLGEWRKFAARVLMFYWVVLVLSEQTEQHAIRYLIVAIFSGMVIESIYTLSDFILDEGSWKDRFYRARAINSDCNWLGTYMILSIPIIALTRVLGVRAWSQRAPYLIGLTSAVLALVASYTRAVWLAFGVEGLAYSVLSGNKRFRRAFLAACLAVMVTLYGLALWGYQENSTVPDTLALRVAVWGKAVEETLAHPLVGAGYGNYIFEKRFHDFLLTAPEVAGQKWLTGPHNYFLMVAMGSGLPALALLVRTLWVAGRRMLLEMRYRPDGEDKHLMMGVLVMMAGYVTENLFNNMSIGSLGYLFWLLMGVGMHSSIRAAQHSGESENGKTQALPTFAVSHGWKNL